MDWMNEVQRRFARAGHALQDDVLAELAEHAADLEASARRDGLDDEAARVVVTDTIARWARSPEGFRRSDVRAPQPAPPSVAGPLLAGLWRDTHFAARLLARRPAPAALSAGTIAVGVAAVSLMASLAWSILLKPLPFPDRDRLVQATESHEGGTSRFGPLFTNATYLAWRDGARTIDGLGAWSTSTYTLAATAQGGTAERVTVTSMTASLGPLVGARPSIGRLLTAADERKGAARVVLLSDEAWTRRFGRRADVVGRPLRLDGESYTVVGVMQCGLPLSRPAHVDVDARSTCPPWSPPASRGTNSRSFAGWHA